MPLGLSTWVDPRNHVLHGVETPNPHVKQQYWGWNGVAHCTVYRVSAVICAKTDELTEMLFEIWTLVCPRKHAFDGVHIGTTWQIKLNHPCGRAVCQITLNTRFNRRFRCGSGQTSCIVCWQYITPQQAIMTSASPTFWLRQNTGKGLMFSTSPTFFSLFQPLNEGLQLSKKDRLSFTVVEPLQNCILTQHVGCR